MSIKYLIWIRRFSQAGFLLFFLFLLVETRIPQDAILDYSPTVGLEQDIRIDYPISFFFKINPLTWLTSLIAGHKWIDGFGWALGVMVLTVFLGRIFCGFICPFGTLHHMTSAIKPALKGRQQIEANTKKPSQRIKYFILVAFILSAVLGLNYTGLMDPISLLFRSLSMAILPGVGIGLKNISNGLANTNSEVLNRISYRMEDFLSPIFGYDVFTFNTGWIIGFIFLVILFLNRIRPRFWCRTLCPLGALLGILSRLSILKLEKDPNACTNCNLCMKNCQGAASPKPDLIWENSECVTCFNCFETCPENAIAFRFKWPLKQNRGPDMGRRAVLGGLTAGIALPLFGGLDGQGYRVPDPRLIRPPGSLEEKAFLELCQRCGLCMKVCPTNAINPTLTEAGMAGFWTPHLIMTHGHCEYTCTLCGSVCPTGAIEKLTGKKKIEQPVRIGSAYIDRGRCLPWSGNTPCIMCEEVCPVSPKSIYLKKSIITGADGRSFEVQLPHVKLKQCIGCGMCENKCPVKGKPAIRVIAAGESRSRKNQILL